MVVMVVNKTKLRDVDQGRNGHSAAESVGLSPTPLVQKKIKFLMLEYSKLKRDATATLLFQLPDSA